MSASSHALHINAARCIHLSMLLQSGMSESGSNVVEIQEVAAEDMKVILKFIYGKLKAIPGDRLQSLVLATDRLQVCIGSDGDKLLRAMQTRPGNMPLVHA